MILNTLHTVILTGELAILHFELAWVHAGITKEYIKGLHFKSPSTSLSRCIEMKKWHCCCLCHDPALRVCTIRLLMVSIFVWSICHHRYLSYIYNSYIYRLCTPKQSLGAKICQVPIDEIRLIGRIWPKHRVSKENLRFCGWSRSNLGFIFKHVIFHGFGCLGYIYIFHGSYPWIISPAIYPMTFLHETLLSRDGDVSRRGGRCHLTYLIKKDGPSWPHDQIGGSQGRTYGW